MRFKDSSRKMSGDKLARELDRTPTWAVAAVCAVIIIISIALEKILHKLGAVCSFPNFYFYVYLSMHLISSFFCLL